MKCVINMSLSGPRSESVNTAVEAAINAGVHVVVAAGNDGVDACTRSPASATSAVTVGSVNSADRMSSFSNHGTCIDIFAPVSSFFLLTLTLILPPNVKLRNLIVGPQWNFRARVSNQAGQRRIRRMPTLEAPVWHRLMLLEFMLYFYRTAMSDRRSCAMHFDNWPP